MACGGGGDGGAFPKTDPISEMDRYAYVQAEHWDITESPIDGVKYSGTGSISFSDEVIRKFVFDRGGWELHVVLPKYYPDEKPTLKFFERIPSHPEINPLTGDVKRFWPIKNEWTPRMTLRNMVSTVVGMLATIDLPPPPDSQLPPMHRDGGFRFELTESEFHHFLEAKPASFVNNLKISNGCRLQYRGMEKKRNKDPHFMIYGEATNVRKVVQGLEEYRIGRKFRNTRSYEFVDNPDTEISMARGGTVSAKVSSTARSSLDNDSAPGTSRATATATATASGLPNLWPFIPETPTIRGYTTTQNLIGFSDSDSEHGFAAAASASRSGTNSAPKENLTVDEFDPYSPFFDDEPTMIEPEIEPATVTTEWNTTANRMEEREWDSLDSLTVLAHTPVQLPELPDELKNISWNDLSEIQKRDFIEQIKRPFVEFSSKQFHLLSALSTLITKMKERLDSVQRKLTNQLVDIIIKKRSMPERRSRVEEMERNAEILHCPICMRRLKNMGLSCGHTFCHICVEYMRCGNNLCSLCQQTIEACWYLFN